MGDGTKDFVAEYILELFSSDEALTWDLNMISVSKCWLSGPLGKFAFGDVRFL